MVINDFIKALHEDEKELAKKFQDDKGTDWKTYILEKEKQGFCKFDDWQFMDYNHIRTQLDSKYKTKWGTRIIGVTINDRKIDVQLFAGGFRKVVKEEQRRLIDMIGESNGAANRLVNEIYRPFSSAGHGVNFSAVLDNDAGERSDILGVLCNHALYNIKALTVVWINHDLMTIVLHEDNTFFEHKAEQEI